MAVKSSLVILFALVIHTAQTVLHRFSDIQLADFSVQRNSSPATTTEDFTEDLIAETVDELPMCESLHYARFSFLHYENFR
jgi:hypothetical protein